PVKAGYASSATVNHYGVLRTLCDGLGLAPIGAAASASPIAEVWGPTGPPPPVFCPAFVAPTPADGTVLEVNAGSAVSFGVAAADSNAGDRVTLRVESLPAGASLTTTPGNPV